MPRSPQPRAMIALIVLAAWHMGFSSTPLLLAQNHDFSDELPRIAPLEPDKAMASFKVAKGFRIEMAAHEPMVVDPIAMAFDEQSRLFVVEMRGYSEDADKNLGRIRLLVDTDNDGRFDKSTIYLDHLSWPTAITCFDGGVFIAVAPDILYCKDIDGDGVADIRKRVFTGFGRGNVQGLVNTLKWGLDHRIHGATSSSGGLIKRVYDPKSVAINLRGRDFSFDPRKLDLRPESGGAQHGMSFDEWGRKFVCSNSDHLQAVMYEDRYAARNPYLASPRSRVSIATDGPQAPVFRISPVEPWRIVRTRLRVAKAVPGPIEGGGKPAGYFTGATGATIYTGGQFGPSFTDGGNHGLAIIGDVGSNIVHRKLVVAKGVGFEANRIDDKSEFVASKDIWFRPAQFANGPDGALYIADMYREVIEHPKSLPPVIKKHLDLTSGRDRGRIYRVVADNFVQPKRQSLAEMSTLQLVQTFESRIGWRRWTADRLLYERNDTAAAAPLRKLASASQSAVARMHAINALVGLGAANEKDIVLGLSDTDPHVREIAIRLAEPMAPGSRKVRDALLSTIHSQAWAADARIRYQLAFTLGGLKDDRRIAALAHTLKADGRDPWIRFAVLSSLRKEADTLLSLIKADKAFSGSATGKLVIADLTKLVATVKRVGDKVAAPNITSATNKRSADDVAAKNKLIESYRPALTMAGNAKRGLQVFTKNCAACHRIETPNGAIGKAIGPNLAAARNRGAEAILANVLDPNREVNPQYLGYHLTTRDSDQHTGMILSESATSLTLLRSDGSTLDLLRADLESIRQTSLSFMPEGLEKSIDVKSMADLLAFLLAQP